MNDPIQTIETTAEVIPQPASDVAVLAAATLTVIQSAEDRIAALEARLALVEADLALSKCSPAAPVSSYKVHPTH